MACYTCITTPRTLLILLDVRTLLALLDAGLHRWREEQHGLLYPAQNRALSERCALGESAFFVVKKRIRLSVSVFRCACVGHARGLVLVSIA